MKFLLDHDVYASTARFLSDLGHDVVPVARIGLSQAYDPSAYPLSIRCRWQGQAVDTARQLKLLLEK